MSAFGREAMRAGWRLILDLSNDDPSADLGFTGEAAWNMAADEALLDSLIHGETPPVLRLYRWKSPAVTLGRFQSLDLGTQNESVDPASKRGSLSSLLCEKLGLPVVRRLTGGRAILHDCEVTYSVIAPHGGEGIVESYQAISECLRLGFKRLGILSDMGRVSAKEGRSHASCFAAATRSDLVLSTGIGFDGSASFKLAGSAQYRRRDALLQQGTIPISWNRSVFAALFGGRPEEEGASCLADAMGRLPDPSEVAEAIAEGFRTLWGKESENGVLTANELESARHLRAERYDNLEWTQKGSRG